MLFNSWQFIFVFFPATALLFFLVPASFRLGRKVVLIVASLAFYGYWKIEYVPLLVGSIIVNYALAEGIIRPPRPLTSRFLLILGVTLNLLLLGYFKYANFGLNVVGSILERDFPPIDVILPLAISFFTFTQLSYLIDVYRDHRVHYRFLDYSLFIAFFPHLIAGPILRHWEIIPQFLEKKLKSSRDDVGVGVTLFLFGLIKKVLLADSAAEYANAIYTAAGQSGPLTTFDAWLGTIAFGFQIYFDFSSYSDMAIGLARIFGIKFPANFNSPYRATSVIAFWERWHMTLTRFLREYVYYSLGGNRRGQLRQAFNIMITMLLSGLWHGAGWTFIVWGALHGTYLLIAHQWRLFVQHRRWNLENRLCRGAGILLTYLAVLFAWIFFRAPNFGVATKVLSSMTARQGMTMPQNMISPHGFWDRILPHLGVHYIPTSIDGVGRYDNAIYLMLFLFFICVAMPNSQQMINRYDPLLTPVDRPSFFNLKIDWKLGLSLGFLCFLVVRYSSAAAPTPFIYFHF
jgi:alginate O-acetyltransferase complex protein AlgI